MELKSLSWEAASCRAEDDVRKAMSLRPWKNKKCPEREFDAEDEGTTLYVNGKRRAGMSRLDGSRTVQATRQQVTFARLCAQCAFWLRYVTLYGARAV